MNRWIPEVNISCNFKPCYHITSGTVQLVNVFISNYMGAQSKYGNGVRRNSEDPWFGSSCKKQCVGVAYENSVGVLWGENSVEAYSIYVSFCSSTTATAHVEEWSLLGSDMD